MQIQWTEDLSVGNEEIDSQHRELLRRLNALWDAISQGIGQEEIENVIAFLEDYVLIHFKYEENQMAIHQYSGMALHKEKHQAFIIKYKGWKEKLEKDGPNPQLASLVLNVLFTWFLSHIKRMDQELGTFLK